MHDGGRPRAMHSLARSRVFTAGCRPLPAAASPVSQGIRRVPPCRTPPRGDGTGGLVDSRAVGQAPVGSGFGSAVRRAARSGCHSGLGPWARQRERGSVHQTRARDRPRLSSLQRERQSGARQQRKGEQIEFPAADSGAARSARRAVTRRRVRTPGGAFSRPDPRESGRLAGGTTIQPAPEPSRWLPRRRTSSTLASSSDGVSHSTRAPSAPSSTS